MVFSFLGVFCNSLPNQVEHTWLKLMSELEFFWLIGVLTQNFNTLDLAKFLEKNKKLHIQIVVTLKITSCRTMGKKKVKKVKNQDFMSKTNFFLAPYPSSLGQYQPHGFM
jgi:hypothetical protein